MKRSTFLLGLLLFAGLALFSQELPISDLGLEQFIEELKLERAPDLESYYLWNGTIEAVVRKNGHLELTLVKARWEGTRKIISYKTVLQVKRPEQIKMILELPSYSRIVYIARILEVNDLVPLCEAVKIYKD